MTDDNSNPDTAEAKINLLFDSYADGDISADEAKQQLKELLVEAQKEAMIRFFDVFEKEIDQQEFAVDEAEWLSLIQAMRIAEKAALQQTRQ